MKRENTCIYKAVIHIYIYTYINKYTVKNNGFKNTLHKKHKKKKKITLSAICGPRPGNYAWSFSNVGISAEALALYLGRHSSKNQTQHTNNQECLVDSYQFGKKVRYCQIILQV